MIRMVIGSPIIWKAFNLNDESSDTDNDGVPDGDEDFDRDGLSIMANLLWERIQPTRTVTVME